MTDGPGGDGRDVGGTGSGGPGVGGVGEEAVKLLQALQDWARESGSDYADATAAGVGSATAAVHRLDEHIATDGADCTYCPLCRVISAVRGTSPEVRDHLRSAGTSLLQAAAGMLATTVPDQGAQHRDSPMEKIDLSDDDEWEDD
jgi:hypothetical protein